MAGTIKTHIQLGDNVTATNNFSLTAQAADGTMKLARGNMGATTQDILTVAASTGIVTVNQGLATLPSVSGSFYEEYTATVTTSGATAQSTTVKAVRVGKTVTVSLTAFNASASSAANISVPANLPASMRPSALFGQVGVARMKNNAAYINAPLLQVDTGGSISFYVDSGGTSFTNGAICGLFDVCQITFHTL